MGDETNEGDSAARRGGRHQAWIRSIASRVLWGPADPALAECANDEEVARLVSEQTAEMLLDRAVGREGVDWGVHVWPTAQRGLRALARVPGAHGEVLGHALFDACIREPLDGPPLGLEQESLVWLLEAIPERIEWLVDYPGALLMADDQSPISQERFIFSALFDLEGQAGARWMLRMLPRHDTDVNFSYQDMRSGERPAWSPQTWVLRLNALAEARLDTPPSLLSVFGIGREPPPVESAPAQVRVACVYANKPTDYLLRTVGDNIASYSTGDPVADIHLIHWDAPPEQRELLRHLLEMAGPPGYRTKLVTAAEEASLITGTVADELSKPMERPAWMDGPVPWTVDQVLDAGVLRLPGGELACADPFWAHEGLEWTITVPRGDYQVRVVTASHPLYPTKNAAIEVLIDAAPEIVNWHQIPTRPPGSDYFIPEIVISLAEAELLADIPPELTDADANSDLSERIFRQEADHVEIDVGARGNVLIFSLGDQHPHCRSWTAHDATGRIVRVLTDLGVLEVADQRTALA